MAGFGIDLTSCDPEIREAFLEALARESAAARRAGAEQRHTSRLATLRRMMGRA